MRNVGPPCAPAAGSLCAGAPFRSISAPSRQGARAVHRWLERRRQLRALSELDDHLLRDIGLSREDAERECSTAFWRRRPFAGNSAGDRRGSRTNPPATCSPHALQPRKCGLCGPIPVALLCALLSSMAPSVEGAPVCRPNISPKASAHSEVVNFQRKWTGVFAVDASRCATAAGSFEIEFVRLKEVGPDLPFTEAFAWRAERTEASLDLTWDEWVDAHRILEIAPCPCR
jgi:uncharacterized protein YjiS (DUF1127 family)